MFYALTRDASGTITCGSRYSEDPGTLPDGEALCTQQEFEAWRAAFLAPPPAPRTISSLDFLGLFTAEEQAGVFTAALKSPDLLGLLFQVACAGTVQLDDPRVVAGLDLLQDTGLVAPSRSAQVLRNVSADAVLFDTARAVESPPARADAVAFDVARAVEALTVRADAVSFDTIHATTT